MSNIYKLIILILISTSIFAQSKIDRRTCTYDGKKLYGKVQFVEDFPDITIQVVEDLPDIDVRMVENFPSKCGEWQLVEHFPNLRVKIVEHNADIKVRFVKHFPGLK
ncbi:MAG: hypothetical protein JETCAE03_31870 [Ignavibacteriaceae bacterium]|nr:MAG: hypothetical protein JETCAE03_31870 [Ignavibacteriaceae bacterium]